MNDLMVYELIGYQKLDFTTDDGKSLDGYSIFVNYVADNVNGLKSDKKYIPTQAINKMGLDLDLLVGRKVNIFCDLKGKPVFIKEV